MDAKHRTVPCQMKRIRSYVRLYGLFMFHPHFYDWNHLFCVQSCQHHVTTMHMSIFHLVIWPKISSERRLVNQRSPFQSKSMVRVQRMSSHAEALRVTNRVMVTCVAHIFRCLFTFGSLKRTWKQNEWIDVKNNWSEVNATEENSANYYFSCLNPLCFHSRLGKCEVCNCDVAKYTCPKCEVKTCRLECLKIHKKELDCDGIRDKTKYISLRNITENDLMNDYVFLEDCTNYAMARKRDKIKRHTSNRPLPVHLKKLRSAAHERSMNLRFLLPNFKRHRDNKTFYDWKTKVIQWSVEWRFPHSNNFVHLDERCDESQSLQKLTEKFFDKLSTSTRLAQYSAEGITKCVFLLKAEGIQRCNERYFQLNSEMSLKENLRNRTIIEFPVILVVFETEIKNYQLISNGKPLYRLL